MKKKNPKLTGFTLERSTCKSMKIGDKTYRLSPGSRIFNRHNLIIMPASLQTQTAPVMYTLDIRGDLASVWLLTGDEAARIPLPK